MTAADRARAALVDALRSAGRVRSPGVEDAFRTVPRHLFLPAEPIAMAYADEAVAVQHVDGATTSSASQPSMMAIMLEQLDLRPGHRVLEVGAGTGYNVALMAHMVGPSGAVTAIDIDADLVERARRNLSAAGVPKVDLCCTDGALGHPAGAPYDRIVLTVGSADVQPEWIAQLAAGGRLLLPLEVRDSQLSVALDLGSDGILRSDSVRSCGFIRLRGVAAGPEPAVPLPGDSGLLLRVPDDSRIDAATVAAALADPGPVRPVAVRLGPADVWDGFGLWLAVSEPGTCRLVAAGSDGERAGELFPAGIRGAAVALAGAAGLAAVVLDLTVDPTDRQGRPPSAAVRAFGPDGVALAGRLTALAEAWDAAGHPTAADLRLVVVPGSSAGPPHAESDVANVVEKVHCRLLLSWAGTHPER